MHDLINDKINCRYVVAVAAIAGAYCIVQLPFAIYHAIQQKRLIRNGFLPQFDFFGDKVLPFLLFIIYYLYHFKMFILIYIRWKTTNENLEVLLNIKVLIDATCFHAKKNLHYYWCAISIDFTDD